MIGRRKYYNKTESGNELPRKACHPAFVKQCRDAFYYDKRDEFSPFGNADGEVILVKLEEWYRNKTDHSDIIAWMLNNIDSSAFDRKITDYLYLRDKETIDSIHERDEYLFESLDNVVIATCFGQFKITGKVDPDLKDLAYLAIDREKLINSTSDSSEDILELLGRLEIMKNDLSHI